MDYSKPGAPLGAAVQAQSNFHPVKRALLAEDDAGNRMVATELLRIMDFTVDAVESGLDAFAKYVAGPYSVGVFDVQMKGIMNGIELISSIREHEKLYTLPPLSILCVTASVQPADRDKCFEAGANDYLAKPYSTAIFQTKINDLYQISAPALKSA